MPVLYGVFFYMGLLGHERHAASGSLVSFPATNQIPARPALPTSRAALPSPYIYNYPAFMSWCFMGCEIC